MLDRVLLWASEKERIQELITDKKVTRGVVDRFVAGDHLDDAISAIRRLNDHGIGGILDLLGEGVVDPAGASAAANDYLDAIKRIPVEGIETTVSVKLTQLGLAFDKGACIDHLRLLAAEAEAVGSYLEIDMEQSEYVTDTLEIYRLLQGDLPGIRVAMQAYLRRTPMDLESLAHLSPRVRLVKGAYKEREELALQKRKEIDRQYAFLVEWLFDHGTDPAIATHDDALLDVARAAAERRGMPTDCFEIQMLYGIRRDLQQELARQGYRVRVYVPFGSAWYPYLMRRMAERPANLRLFLRAVVGR